MERILTDIINTASPMYKSFKIFISAEHDHATKIFWENLTLKVTLLCWRETTSKALQWLVPVAKQPYDVVYFTKRPSNTQDGMFKCPDLEYALKCRHDGTLIYTDGASITTDNCGT
jgi:hypothetical protein